MQIDQMAVFGIDAELNAVRQLITDVADQLDAPLRQLVHARIAQAQPLLRAGVVLASAVNDESSDDAEDYPLVRHRIHLAAALEMLHIAHNIHKLLLVSGSEEMDASVMGSTILAGDFCFSHAAVLAAKTDNPDVVAIFAQGLKTISENNLKKLFENADNTDEDRVLFVAGVQAAVVLAQLTSAQQSILMQYIDLLSPERRDSLDSDLFSHTLPNGDHLLETQQQRLLHLFTMVA